MSELFPGIVGICGAARSSADDISEIVGTALPGALDGWWASEWSDQLAFVDSKVSQANDLSGNARHATQATAALRPVVTDAGFSRTLLDDPKNLGLPSAIGDIIEASSYVAAVDFTTGGDTDMRFAPLATFDSVGSTVDALTLLGATSVTMARGTQHTTPSQRAGVTSTVYSAMVSFKGRLWAYGGRVGASTYTNTIHVSDDGGATWTSMGTAAWAGRAYHAIAKQGDKLVLVGGYAGATIYADEWTSTDGTTWVETAGPMAFGSRNTPRMLACGDSLALLGGGTTGGDRSVWMRSATGTWSVVAATGGTFGIGEIRWAVLNGTIYVVSGNGSSTSDDVWRLDGTVWTLVTSAAGFPARRLAGVWSSLGKLYVAFGLAGAALADVYCSSDGVTWSAVNAATGWAIYGSSMCVHRGVMYFLREDAQGYYVMLNAPSSVEATVSATLHKSLVLVANGTTRTVYEGGAVVATGTVTSAGAFAGDPVAQILGGTGPGSVRSLAIFTPKAGQTMADVIAEAQAFAARLTSALD